MDGQVTARTLVCAIPKAVIVRWVNKRLEEMGKVPNGTGTFLTLSTATVFVLGAVLSEVLEFLWPFLATAGLDAVGAVSDDVGCDGVQQRIIPQLK